MTRANWFRNGSLFARYTTKIHCRCPTWPANVGGGHVSCGNKYVLFVVHFYKKSFCSENPVDRCEVSYMITTDTSCLYYDSNSWVPFWALVCAGNYLMAGQVCRVCLAVASVTQALVGGNTFKPLNSAWGKKCSAFVTRQGGLTPD